jgi:lipoprotein-releasing system ATP-binding protein
MLHILGLLDRPTSGTVSFEGQDLFQLPEAAQAEFRNKRIGFVFQFHHLLPEFTALENACMPALIQRRQPDDVRAEATAILNDVGLGASCITSPASCPEASNSGSQWRGRFCKSPI